MLSRLGLLLACALGASACAPGFLAVRQPPVSMALPDGPSQGPFKVSVPLDPRWPHRVTVSYTGRCQPLFTADVSVVGREVKHEDVGSHNQTWQQALREHFLGQGAPARTAPQPAAAPGPAPGVGVQVGGAGYAQPGQASGVATGTATVTLPGHWEQQLSVDQAFEAERLRACAESNTFNTSVKGAYDPGLTGLDVVLWSEVPQFVQGGSLSVVVEQLQTPETPKPPQKPPAPGATWVAGTWTWRNNGYWTFGWEWEDGVWSAPPGGPPPPKAGGKGNAPNPGAVWADGSWRWDSSAGWVWSEGRWFIPERPTGGPPPPKNETHGPNPPGLGARWYTGSWGWDVRVGWVWTDGEWMYPADAWGPPPPLKNEFHGVAPGEGAQWASGSWRWKGGEGWLWVDGRWVFPATPPGAPPPPKDDSHGEPDCPGWVWVTGKWEWTTSSGWEWTRGFWGEKHADGPLPPPKNEAQGFAPSVDASWAHGKWAWDICYAKWVWLPGQWRTHARTASVEVELPQQRLPPPPPPRRVPRAEAVVESSAPACTMTAPPSPRAEAQPPSPVAGSVWMPGLWKWTRCEWAWTAGRWNVPPAPNMVWVPGPTFELGRWVVGGAVQAVPPPGR